MGLYFYRVFGAITLDASMYEGIEHDRTTTTQAALTVLLASIAAGLGHAAAYGFSVTLFVAATAVAVVAWVAWAMLMFQIGTFFLPASDTHATLGELLRTTGFAAAPGVLQGLAVMHALAMPAHGLSVVWMVAAMVVAVKHALDYRSTARAVLVCLAGAGLCVALAMGLALLFSRTAS